MLDHTSNTNIRIKKAFPLDNSKLMKTTGGLVQTKYSQPFGKYFIDKNKDRINPHDNPKYSDRYLVNVTKLQRISNNDKDNQNSRPTMNRTLSNCISNEQFNHTQSVSKCTSTSQSHRSSLLAVNLKRLPRLNPSTTGFNGSHNKMEMIKDEVEMLGNDVIDLSTQSRDFCITFGRIKLGLQNHCDQVKLNLKNKVSDLEKLVNNTKQQNNHRTEQLKRDCIEIKQNNVQLKHFLQMIQQKIEGVENALGITTAHHKHFA